MSSQEIVTLGFLINSLSMKIKLTGDKATEYGLENGHECSLGFSVPDFGNTNKGLNKGRQLAISVFST